MSKSKTKDTMKLGPKEIFMEDEENLDNITWLERLGRKRSIIGNYITQKRKDSNYEVNPLALRQSIAEFGINVDEDISTNDRRSLVLDSLRRHSNSSVASMMTDDDSHHKDRRSSLTIGPSNRKSLVGDESISYVTSPLTTKRNSIIFSDEELL